MSPWPVYLLALLNALWIGGRLSLWAFGKSDGERAFSDLLRLIVLNLLLWWGGWFDRLGGTP